MSSNLEKLIGDLEKKSKNSVRWGKEDLSDIPRIDMTNLNLMYLFRGGFPEGKIYEFYGQPSSGKGVLSYMLLSNWQKLPHNKDRKAVIFDVECSHTDRWAKTLGVDMTNVIIWRPMNNESAEETFDIINEFADTEEVGFIILDSIGSLVPKNRKDKNSFGEKTMGGIAAPLTDFINEFNWRVNKYNITFVGINQIREDFKDSYSKGSSPGGKAFKHACGIRLNLSACDYFDYKGSSCSRYSDAAGHHILVIVEKNKETINDRKRTTVTFRYLSGIDDFEDNIEFAILNNYIKGSGAWYELFNYSTGELLDKKLNGRKQVYEYFKNNPENYSALVKTIEKDIVKGDKYGI